MTEPSIELTRGSMTPLYLQVAHAIEQSIRSGEIPPGGRLESEVAMADRLGLSRPTIRQAMQELTERGLLIRRRGVGTQVARGQQIELAAAPPGHDHTGTSLSGWRTNQPMPATGLIGLAVPDLANPFFAETAQFIERRARRFGFFLLTADTDEDPGTELATIAQMREQVKGMILAAPRAGEDDLRRVVGQSSDVVLINREVAGLGSVTVNIDTGMHQAVAHLAALGHRRIGYIAGPTASRAGQRIETSLTDAGQALGCDVTTLAHVEPNHAGGYAVADVVVASDVTSVVAHNDLIAFGLISRLSDRGIRVPDDISVIGCDNIPFSAMLTPTLTTVAVDRSRLGQAAMDLLARRLVRTESIEPPDTSIASQLVVRESTGHPNSSRPPSLQP